MTPPRLVVVVVDGLPCDLLERSLPSLPFVSARLPYRATAVSCFPSTTGPAYFPFLAGCTPGRANVPGIRWFDRTRATATRFPHRGLRSYVGPDAKKLASDTAVKVLYERDAWPVSSPIGKDVPKGLGEKSRDLVWAFAHFTDRWDLADRRTAWKLGRGMRKGRSIVFAVFPSVDEYGHMESIAGGRPAQALVEIDRLLAAALDDYDGELILSADHGLTDTHTHIDLRAVVQELVGSTVAFPLTAKPDPKAVVCESGNAMANVYLRGDGSWRERPSAARCREVARELLAVEGVDSVAIRGERESSAELLTGTGTGTGEVGFEAGRLWQRGDAFRSSFEGATPREALRRSLAEEHPDAAFSLLSLLASERAGDLLVSASVGFDLRARREWPEHFASHGALHRAHTVVPVLASSPLPDGPLRTLDVFPAMLQRAGIPLADYAGSDAELLARDAWEPGVAR
ncbi:MAG: alkaline phosphatase family protein [Actinomycetota bacterium]|nr:alkaline phosphatase family protein [Actinomycetota bacterium]